MSLQSSLGKNRTAVLHRHSGRLLPPSSSFTFTLSAFLTGNHPLSVCHWEMWNFTLETVCSGRSRECLAASELAVSVV